MYESEGKQAFRELLLSLARHSGCRTYGTFWGTGIDSRLFASAGFDVMAAEVVRAKHEAMEADAATGGYRAFHGRAGKMSERLDMFHADFDGGPSPANFREVRRIAAVTDKWLAVTLSMDHQRDEAMMGESAFYTIPGWLTGSSGFTLEYLSRYKRNEYGQVMWVAILSRPADKKGLWRNLLPHQIKRCIEIRGYWASISLHRTGLLPHRKRRYSNTPRDIERHKEWYQDHREERLEYARQHYEANKDRYLALTKAWYQAHPGKGTEYTRRWKAKRLAAVSGTTAEAIKG